MKPAVECLFVAALAAGCRSGASPPPAAPKVPDAPAPRVAAHHPGRASYLQLCAPCHGDDGEGYRADHAPSLVNPTFLESASETFLNRSIAEGRPGTAMAAYGRAHGGPLDARGIDLLVDYLRSMGPAPRAATPGGAGDAQRGRALYATHCQACHGDQRTRGEAIHLANPMFLAHADGAFIRHAIVHGRPGTKMPAFAATLTAAQIDDVSTFVRGLAAGGAALAARLPAPSGQEPLVIHPQGRDPAFEARDGRFVGVEQVERALRQKRKMIIIDARPPSDWMRVHIEGAVSIAYHDMKRLEEVPKDVTVIAYCACPHHLSGEVVDELRRRGHERAYVLDEGINEWHRRGYPVTAAEGVGPPPR